MKSTLTCRDQQVLAAMPVFNSSPVEISAWNTCLKCVFSCFLGAITPDPKRLHMWHVHTTEPLTPWESPDQPRAPLQSPKRKRTTDAVFFLKFLSLLGKNNTSSCRNPSGSLHSCKTFPISRHRHRLQKDVQD